jgi:hypothetical protein
VPGVKPPTGIEPEDVGRATGVVGTGVGICDSELTALPHDEQNRLLGETGAEQEGHVMLRNGVDIGGKSIERSGLTPTTHCEPEGEPLTRLSATLSPWERARETC